MISQPTFVFSRANITALKKALRGKYPELGSSHADEALAAGFGFNTHAAMLQILRLVGDTARMVVGINHSHLAIRLMELGYPNISPIGLWLLISEVEFPVRVFDDSTEQTVRALRRPDAANSG